ncbi:hypothetical protein Pan181_45890 [Aeoliella mucimassa]|uniref:Type VI secretion system baseplate subunit TssK n=2 Tax=Aeoliella mucimassa TaxID=2527972 RepID=A0A518AUH6_9BACT|nr:hypothetical protein Pan181_45890 [Aeoliella mucimassa]
MFLAPQHYQLADRFSAQTLQRDIDWTRPYGWGIRDIEVDQESLANHRFLVRQLRARLPGGEVLSVPDDTTLPVIDLRSCLQKDATVRIFLAVPLHHLARANVAESPESIEARYLVSNAEVPDENLGTDARTVQVRRLNARLLTSQEDHAGFETLPIAQVRRSHRSTSVPEIDPTYVPPLLACDGWQPLHAEVLGRLTEHLGRKRSVLQAQATSRSIDFDCAGQGERLLLEQLRVLNTITAELAVDIQAVGIPPFFAYRQLASIVGQLSVFASEIGLPTIPAYNHDELGKCFFKLRDLIEQQLDEVAEPRYEQRPFMAEGTLLNVELAPNWFDEGHLLLVGVRSSLDTDEVEQLFRSGRFLKVGSRDRANELYLQGAAGLKLTRVGHPPRALPLSTNVSYYLVEKDEALGEWREVMHSLTLAARFGEQVVIDHLPDGQTIVVNFQGHTSTLALSLFAVPKAKARVPFGFEASSTDIPLTV